jgi:hypothetical protein
MSEPKVNVELGASARLEIKTEIPAKSTGRLVDALTDLIRPFSEARGLRGDEIRLQREEVAIEIARRALERKALEEEAIVPVANKVLVPLLEQASLEDIDDDVMMERWAVGKSNLHTAALCESAFRDQRRPGTASRADVFRRRCHLGGSA